MSGSTIVFFSPIYRDWELTCHGNGGTSLSQGGSTEGTAGMSVKRVAGQPFFLLVHQCTARIEKAVIVGCISFSATCAVGTS
jgi:hypothetical protein